MRFEGPGQASKELRGSLPIRLSLTHTAILYMLAIRASMLFQK